MMWLQSQEKFQPTYEMTMFTFVEVVMWWSSLLGSQQSYCFVNSKPTSNHPPHLSSQNVLISALYIYDTHQRNVLRLEKKMDLPPDMRQVLPLVDVMNLGHLQEGTAVVRLKKRLCFKSSEDRVQSKNYFST